MTTIRRVHLKKIPLFSDLTNAELNLILGSAKKRRYPKGSIVFNEGDAGDFLLVIYSGKVKVVLYGEKGEEIILAMLGPGNFFGEMGLLSSRPRSATVLTMEPSEFLHLDQQSFSSLITTHPPLALKILKYLSHRLKQANEQIRTLVMFDVYGRIARCLLNLIETQGIQTKQNLVLCNRPSFQDLAHMIGCSRETVSRAINVLKREGYLTVSRKEIVIHRTWKK